MQRSELDEVAGAGARGFRQIERCWCWVTSPRARGAGRFTRAHGADSLYAHIAEVYPTWNDSFERDCSESGGELIDHVLTVPGRRKAPLSRRRIVVSHDRLIRRITVRSLPSWTSKTARGQPILRTFAACGPLGPAARRTRLSVLRQAAETFRLDAVCARTRPCRPRPA